MGIRMHCNNFGNQIKMAINQHNNYNKIYYDKNYIIN